MSKRIVFKRFIKSIASILCCLCLMPAHMAYAGGATIVVDNQTGDDTISVEVIADGKSCMISADNSWNYFLDINPGTIQVAARVSGDSYGYYKAQYEPEMELEEGGIIKITVTYSEEYGEEGEEFEEGYVPETFAYDPDSYKDGYPDNGYEEIKLSKGAEDTATLYLACTPVYAFDEVTLSLTDEDYKTYRIPMHMDPYFFRAKVILPAGKYLESGTPEPVFNVSASADESLSYVWTHTGGTSFGGFFTLEPGTETNRKDYEVKTMRSEEITDTDSRYYFSKNQYEKESEAESKISEEFHKQAYQNLSNGETAPAPIGEEENGFKIGDLVRYVPAAVGIILLILLFAGVKKAMGIYWENNRRH